MSYLIFGGTGFIGRNLVQYLLDNNISSRVCVVDKIPPSMAWLNDKHKATFEDDRVEFVSCNLAVANSLSKLEGQTFDYVLNLATETKLSLSREVYDERVYRVSMNCANFAKECGAKMFVEFSTAQVYGTHGKLSKETDKVNPKYDFEICKLNVEKDLASIEGLNYIILRLGIVYGVGDKYGYVTSQLVVAAVYSYLKEVMQLIWKPSMSINLVHVEDLCGAVVHLLANGKHGEIYNIVDEGDTNLDTICKYVSNIFSTKYEYLNKMTNFLASLSLKDVAEGVNEKHLAPWSQMCNNDNIANTPLSPFIYSSQLETLNVRASNEKLVNSGFQFKHPQITESLIKEVITDFVDMKIFPPSIISSRSSTGS